MKPCLTYLPLESYAARYTELLSAKDGWADKVFGEYFDVERIEGEEAGLMLNIETGEVLDRLQRPRWGLQQSLKLLNTDRPGGKASSIYFEDFFHPGLDALVYARVTQEHPCYAFCWAQTFDQFDFTRKDLRFAQWMRAYETGAYGELAGVFVASELLAEFIGTTFLDRSKVHVVGLPFNSKDVVKRANYEVGYDKYDVVYSSRFDEEKNPMFFLDIVEAMPELKFCICTGHSSLRGEPKAVARATKLWEQGKLSVLISLSKADYYGVLSKAVVQFNTSSQDWVSFTLLEALSLGCYPLYPRHRDFVSVFQECPGFLYTPLNRYAVEEKLRAIISEVGQLPGNARSYNYQALQNILVHHNGTLGRIAETILARER